jgi:ribonuclease VapC
MVIDTSAVLAILNLESEAKIFTQAIVNDPIRLLSAGTALELSILDMLFLNMVKADILPA